MIKQIFPVNSFNERLRHDFLDENDLSVLVNAYIDDNGTIKAEKRIQNNMLKELNTTNYKNFYLYKPVMNMPYNLNNWIILCVNNNNNLVSIYYTEQYQVVKIFSEITFSDKISYALIDNKIFIGSSEHDYLHIYYLKNNEQFLEKYYLENPKHLLGFSASGTDNQFTIESEEDWGMAIKAGSILQYVYTKVDHNFNESNPSAINTLNKVNYIRHNTLWYKTTISFPALDDNTKYYNLYRRNSLYSESESMSNFSLVAKVYNSGLFVDRFPSILYVNPSYEKDTNVSGDCLAVSNRKLFIGNAKRNISFPYNFKKYKRIEINNQENKNYTDSWIKINKSELLNNTELQTALFNNKLRFIDIDRTTVLKTIYDDTYFYINIPYRIALQTHFIYLAWNTDDILHNNFDYGFPVNINSQLISLNHLPVQHNKNNKTLFNWSGQHWTGIDLTNFFNIADITSENISYHGANLSYHIKDFLISYNNFYKILSKHYLIPDNLKTFTVNNCLKGTLKFSVLLNENSDTFIRIYSGTTVSTAFNFSLSSNMPSFNRSIPLNICISYHFNLNTNKVLYYYSIHGILLNGQQYIDFDFQEESIQNPESYNFDNFWTAFQFKNPFYYTNIYFEKDLYLTDENKIKDFINNISIADYSLHINEEKNVFEDNKKYLCFSDGSGKYFPESNLIIQDELIQKIVPDTNLKDNKINGIYIFYKNKIKHMVIIQESGKQETVITDINDYSNYNADSIFQFSHNIYFIDKELKDLQGNILSQKIKKDRLNSDSIISFEPDMKRLVITSNNDLLFYDFKSDNFSVFNAGSKTKQLLPVNDKLLVIGDNVKTYPGNLTNLFSRIATKLFTTNNKIKILRIMVKGKEQNGVIAEFSISGKYKNNSIEHEFESLNKWHWLQNNNVFTEFKIFVNHFETIESILLDIVERQ